MAIMNVPLLSVILVLLFLLNFCMLSVATTNELMHSLIISDVHLLVSAFALYFLLRKRV